MREILSQTLRILRESVAHIVFQSRKGESTDDLHFFEEHKKALSSIDSLGWFGESCWMSLKSLGVIVSV